MAHYPDPIPALAVQDMCETLRIISQREESISAESETQTGSSDHNHPDPPDPRYPNTFPIGSFQCQIDRCLRIFEHVDMYACHVLHEHFIRNASGRCRLCEGSRRGIEDRNIGIAHVFRYHAAFPFTCTNCMKVISGVFHTQKHVRGCQFAVMPSTTYGGQVETRIGTNVQHIQIHGPPMGPARDRIQQRGSITNLLNTIEEILIPRLQANQAGRP